MGDTGGNTPTLAAETAIASSWFTAVNGDITKILKVTLPVSNNNATSVGGGGTPRVGFAPPLAGNGTASSSSGERVRWSGSSWLF